MDGAEADAWIDNEVVGCEFPDVRHGKRLRQLLENLHLNGTEEQVLLIHALSVGLAVVDLATQRPHSKRRVEAILESLFATLASKDKKQ